MKFTWMKWSALPAAVLLTGGVVLAQSDERGKAQINKQQNQMSKQIYADKHDANTANPGNSKVGKRQENQQDRIAQGVKSG